MWNWGEATGVETFLDERWEYQARREQEKLGEGVGRDGGRGRAGRGSRKRWGRRKSWERE